MGTARFILGLAGSGKTSRVLAEIAELLRTDPLGPPIFLLVPDQATLLYERLAADASDTGGYVRLQIITFRDLTERLLAETGGSSIPEVTALGRRILIGRLLRRMQPELTFYKSTARQPGLANQLDNAFAEIEQSGASLDDLTRLAVDIEDAHPQSALPAKLRDIRLLFAEYEKLLGGERLDQHRRHKQSLDAATKSLVLPSAHLYVDSFHDFTRTERDTLVQVARAGCAVTIALTLDPDDATSQHILDDDHPFRLSTHAFRRLQKALADARVATTVERLDTAPRFTPDALLHLQKHFLRHRPAPLRGAIDALRMIQAPSPRAEVDAAARQIIDWLSAGLRLRDILVLCRDTDVYLRHLEASFNEHRLAYFVDRQNPAAHHPLIRTIRAMIQVALSQWHPDTVLELLKSGLIGIDDATCDALENYVLAHHIRGADGWQKEWSYKLRRVDDDEAERVIVEETARINEARAKLWAGLQPLMQCDDAHLCTAADWCRQLCTALDSLGANGVLAQRIVDAENDSDPDTAARHREVWQEFIALLDQLAAVLDGDSLSLREFAEVMDVALERFSLTIAPPTIDQILVGGVERTRSGPVKACIVLGFSEGRFPKRHDDTTALSDDDRRLLEERQIEVRTGSRAAQLNEQFLAYLALTRASEKLTILRPATDDDGRSLSPSMFWTHVRDIFPSITLEDVSCQPTASCLATPRQLIDAAIRWHASPVEAATTSARELTGYVARCDLPELVSLRTVVARANGYGNVASLSSSVAGNLFASPLKTSATRLETFAACPFKHFAQHGLGLVPREAPRVTAMDLGTIYHRVLEKLVRRAIREDHDLAKPLPDLPTRLESLGHEAAEELREELMLTPGRSDYLFADMRRTLGDVVETQRLAMSLGSFRPHHAELAFGFDERGAPPLRITTPRGRVVELRGKIDRVDLTRIADRIAATIIDYKLSARVPNLDQIYFGLNLQLVVYLLVLGAIGETLATDAPISPAAALYVKLARRVTSVGHPSDALAPPDQAFFLNSDNRSRGLIDEDYIDALDPNATGFSAAYSLRRTKEPVDGKRNDVLDHATFESLVAWTRRRIGQLADQILSGKIDVEPYRMNTATPCSTCAYRSVCRLDLRFNHYRHIPTLGDNRLPIIVEEARR